MAMLRMSGRGTSSSTAVRCCGGLCVYAFVSKLVWVWLRVARVEHKRRWETNRATKAESFLSATIWANQYGVHMITRATNTIKHQYISLNRSRAPIALDQGSPRTYLRRCVDCGGQHANAFPVGTNEAGGALACLYAGEKGKKAKY